ncbi:MAG: Mycobacterial proteasome ATPase [Candidatus Accumulibacter phosphatis]|uniref:Mycobacterial proteasome ATPase n=1 Tax=Candidatus Accumulibacter phosphatis TaxID=327160 RepID=A0A080MAC4_9PROT|nr:ATP-binding protein [Accumulibacter sp.]KFB74049.1 MAG: Mycobacterial proteasome ATPase [Candidatus Accumulibacter phosphatis]HRF06673.1 ATP-binding protein [Accumulibacter sp.]
MNAATLAPEWERIDLLGACLSAWRGGADIPGQITERLERVQQDVAALRQREPWHALSSHYGLDTIDQDILACSLAPEVEPRLGWMYQELQQGLASPYPTPALIRELFVLGAADSQRFHQRLTPGAPLLRSGMVQGEPAGLFQPLQPSPRARQQLLGWPSMEPIGTPGALEVACNARWPDLVLPEHCLRQLREFILWVTHRRQVEQQWGARIDGGPVALFSGPSGTGKTLASEVVANALGWPLLRVDLGLLVSKYIGETEKNLNALFDGAAGRQVVLLFDEADALFAKRGEVKEARDRYANMEVSHLLSRIERHNGPCILTTNLRKHIDAAFTRRFQMIIEFPRAEAEARAQMWELHIPPRAPRQAEVDTRLLGAEFNLSGGQIRNAALHAAFLAAGEGRAIGLAHIASAVHTEFSKKGGEQSASGLGRFAQYLNGGVTP